MKIWLTSALVVATGLLAGLTGAIYAQRSTEPQANQPAASTSPRPLAEPWPTFQPANPESCPSELPPNTESTRPVDSATTSGKGKEQSSRPMNPQAQLVTEKQEQSKRLVAHTQEPRDPSWATQMEGVLSGAFQALSQTSSLRYSAVECRYVSCSAKLSWQDGDVAREEVQKVATLHDGLPCTRFVVLDELPITGVPVAGSAVFDCQQARLDDAPDGRREDK